MTFVKLKMVTDECAAVCCLML